MVKHDPRIRPAPHSPDKRVNLDGLSAETRAVVEGLETLRESYESNRQQYQTAWEDVHPIDNLPALVQQNAGTYSQPEGWSPEAGNVYDYRYVTITLGSGTTLVSVYRGDADPTRLVFSTTVSGFWEPRQCIIRPNDRFTFVSVGGGLTVVPHEVNWIAEHYLPAYLS